MPDDAKLIVYIVDDDRSVRQALWMRFYSAGSNALAFASANEFLERKYKKKNRRAML